MKYVVFQRYLLYQLLFSVVPGSVIVCVHVCVCLFVVSVHVFVCVCPCAETCLGVLHLVIVICKFLKLSTEYQII